MEVVATQQKNRIHPHKFTMWIAIGSILMMFAGLTSAYIVKSNAANWEVIDTPKEFYYSTAVLLISSVVIQMSLRAFKQREMGRYRSFIIITAVLGIVFVLLQLKGFDYMWDNGVRFRGAGQGQFLYVIAGLHLLHVVGGIIALLVMAAKAFTGKTRSYNATSVEVASTYWHFVDALWIYLLVFFIYLG